MPKILSFSVDRHEGEGYLYDYHLTDSEELRTLPRDIYRACGNMNHYNWENYDQAMRNQEAIAVLIRPQQIWAAELGVSLDRCMVI